MGKLFHQSNEAAHDGRFPPDFVHLEDLFLKLYLFVCVCAKITLFLFFRTAENSNLISMLLSNEESFIFTLIIIWKS